MKKICILALSAVLTVGLLTACRSQNTANSSSPSSLPAPSTQATTVPTTQPTTQPTQPSTEMTQPSTDMPEGTMGDMIPGMEDTIDPSNGENQETEPRTRGRTAPRA